MHSSFSARVQLRTPRCQHADRCKFHPSLIVSAATSHKQLQHRVIIDTDAVVSGLHNLTAHWAFAAARSAFGDSEVPGSPRLYQRYLQQLLPVTHHPIEAVLLIRLLADEGIVGSRSASGREGPVVGRSVRHSGSRPLLIQEILEFWQDEIQPTCLLRWCRQMGLTAQQLQQRVDEEYLRAQELVEWRLLDTQGICHGSSSSSSGSSSDHNLYSDAHGSSSTTTSSSSSTSRQITDITAGSTVGNRKQPITTAVVTAAAADKRAMVQQQQQSTFDAAPHIATTVVQPYSAVVQALISCHQQQVHVMSTYPSNVTTAALLAAGLGNSSSNDDSSTFPLVLQGRNIAACVQQLQHQQQRADLASESQPWDCSSSSSGGSSSSSQLDPACTWILSSPNKAASVYAAFGGRAVAAGGLAQQQQQQQQSSLCLQVGDWACVSPSLRAKALASPRMGLLSDIGLAEMLGVAECDMVMDGIAWRR